MPLPMRSLGGTGVEISVLGLGAWAMGGGGWSYAWGPQDDEQSIATIRHAAAHGVTWVDTAAVYGYGHAEEVVGRAIREIPDGERPLVFTKCGPHWEDRDRMAPTRSDLRPESIRAECEASLRRLGVERIDLYQFHRPDELGTPLDDSWATMLELVDEGKVRLAGVSNFDVPLLEACARRRAPDSDQPRLSMIDRGAAEAVIPWCESHGSGVICYSPMHSGLLTDRMSPERVRAMPADDWRRRSGDFREPALSRNLGLRDALRPVAARLDTTVASLAIAWTLAWPGISGAIVGARSPEQVDGWMDAARVEIDDATLDELAMIIERVGAGQGPRRPDRRPATSR